MTFSQCVHGMYDVKMEAVSFTQFTDTESNRFNNAEAGTLQPSVLSAHASQDTCTLMYRYELQRSESVPVLHCSICPIRPTLNPQKGHPMHKKDLQTTFSTRQFMYSEDFEVYYLSLIHI